MNSSIALVREAEVATNNNDFVKVYCVKKSWQVMGSFSMVLRTVLAMSGGI